MSQRCAIVFPGQGSQRPGMLEHLPDVPDLDRLLDAAEGLSGLPLRDIARGDDESALSDTRAAQPLLFLADWAWGVTLISEGIEPVALAGHSLGELAAVTVAGCISVEAGLELVVLRSRLMAEAAAASPGAMAAVLGMDRDDVVAVLSGVGGVWVANDNAPGQVVISGTKRAVEEDALRELTAAGARRVVPLKVSGAFHSPLMTNAAERFAEVLCQVQFRDAAYPIVQNAAPEPARDGRTIRSRLEEQIVRPVRWTETMLRLLEMGADTLIEAGPGSVLSGLARRVEGLTGLSVDAEGLDRIREEVSR
ncbi:MAG: ACP S-malonyltransferase [Coriobacteriia bacterium]|nr:ACP S-malonyltransferase [Coriobacteriia bacterium]